MSRKRWIWLGALSLGLIAIGAIIWSLRDDYAYARIATGFAAKQTCSCLHVSGRTMDSCMTDFPEEVRDSIRITQDGESVRASVLLGAVSAEAVHEEGYGCRIAG